MWKWWKMQNKLVIISLKEHIPTKNKFKMGIQLYTKKLIQYTIFYQGRKHNYFHVIYKYSFSNIIINFRNLYKI